MIINITTPVVDDNRLFVSSFYDGSLMLSCCQTAWPSNRFGAFSARTKSKPIACTRSSARRT